MSLYSISLLNDLHNHFPDILYRPERFRTVQDLLQYINHVAQTNPYNRGLSMYQRHINTPDWEMDDSPTIYIPSNNSIISRLITGMFGPPNSPDLENVIVRPTVNHITNATTIYQVNTLQDDICTICQDNIQSGDVRRITQCNHYFHQTCIDTWFQESVYCPTCRHDIREV